MGPGPGLIAGVDVRLRTDGGGSGGPDEAIGELGPTGAMTAVLPDSMLISKKRVVFVDTFRIVKQYGIFSPLLNKFDMSFLSPSLRNFFRGVQLSSCQSPSVVNSLQLKNTIKTLQRKRSECAVRMCVPRLQCLLVNE